MDLQLRVAVQLQQNEVHRLAEPADDRERTPGAALAERPRGEALQPQCQFAGAFEIAVGFIAREQRGEQHHPPVIHEASAE